MGLHVLVILKTYKYNNILEGSFVNLQEQETCMCKHFLMVAMGNSFHLLLLFLFSRLLIYMYMTFLLCCSNFMLVLRLHHSYATRFIGCLQLPVLQCYVHSHILFWIGSQIIVVSMESCVMLVFVTWAILDFVWSHTQRCLLYS